MTVLIFVLVIFIVNVDSTFISTPTSLKYPIVISFDHAFITESTEFRDRLDIIDDDKNRVYVMVHDEKELHDIEWMNKNSGDNGIAQYEAQQTEILHKIPNHGSYSPTFDKHRIGLPEYPTIEGYPCYRTVEGSYETMAYLTETYPELVELVSIGKSYQYRDMQVMVLTNRSLPSRKIRRRRSSITDISKPPHFVLCGIHPRELAPVEACARFVELLLQSYVDGTDSDATWILDQNEIHVILQSNPDGRVDEEKYLHYRRKNMNSDTGDDDNFVCRLLLKLFDFVMNFVFFWKSRSDPLFGVDLNRNFPHTQWGTSGVGPPLSETYPGKSAGSEAETQAIVGYMESVLAPGTNEIDPQTGGYRVNSSIGVLTDVHSYGRLLLWPWAYINELEAPNEVQLRAMAKKMASFTEGRRLYDTSNDFYPTSGDTTDWAHEALGIAAYTIEIGDTFHQDCQTFVDEVSLDLNDFLKYAARLAGGPYLYSMGPDVVLLEASVNVQEQLLEVITTVSDSERAGGVSTGSQSIAEVRLYVDKFPSQSDEVVAAERIVLDLSTSTSTETVTFSVSVKDLSEGKHILYIQSFDTDGPGPIYSSFFNV